MKDRIVLITGANGFIGSHLVERFISEGYKVRGLVRKSSDLSFLKGMDLELTFGDVTEPQSLEGAVKDVSIVIHNAGFASDWGPLSQFMHINFEGTKNLAEAAEIAGVKRFVLLSSVAIHGFGSVGAMDESSEIRTQGFHYSISKWEAENWLMNFGKTSKMEVTAIRPGNVFGARDHTFIENYLNVILKGQGGYINSGKSKTCPTYVKNLTQGIALAASHPQAPGEAFIITDGLDITWREFTDKLSETMGIKKPTLSMPFGIGYAVAAGMEGVYKLFNAKKAPLLTRYRIRNGGQNYNFSIEKARKVLGYQPETHLNTAIADTVKWYLSKHISQQ